MTRPSTHLFALPTITLVAAALMFGSARPSFAQGSAGGSIGKQGKSASGGEEPPPRSERSKPSTGRKAARESGPFTAASLRGHWTVKTTCNSGADSLSFIIRTTSANSFVGDYEPGGGKITQGSVEGNRVTLTTSSMFTVTWTATVHDSGGQLHMDGGYTPGAPPGNCKFSAVKG
jgi:hypothetical protein